MGNRKAIASLSYDKDHAEEFLGAALGAYRLGLGKAVEMLAEIKGIEDLAWLDELRDSSVKSAKGTITEHIPIVVEAGALRFGFQTLEAEFEFLRSRLVKPK